MLACEAFEVCQHLLDVQHVGVLLWKPEENASTVEARTQPEALSPRTISELMRMMELAAIAANKNRSAQRELIFHIHELLP